MSKTLSQIIETARQYDLEGVESIDVFTQEEIAKIYNGIGPDRFPDAVRELVTEVNEIFAPAALIHDLRYHIGGTKEDFTAANDEFRENCYTLVNAAYAWYDPRRYYWEFKAWRFAGYCQKFGWSGYHKTGEKCECSRCAVPDAADADDEPKEETETATGGHRCAGCDECDCGKNPKINKKAKRKGKDKK